MFIATPSQATTGSYFMGFKNKQIDRIKKGLFILAFALRFMIRALDLLDLSRKEVSVPFQALLLIWSIILLHFQATLPGIEITKDMLWEAGHGRGSFQEWVPTASLKLVSVIAPCSLHIKFSTVSYQMQTISADLHSWERKVGPLFLSSPPTPSLPLPLLPFPTVAISDLFTPSRRYGQRSLKCQQSSSPFPTVPPEGQTSSCGKEPSAPWHTELQHPSGTHRGKCRTGEDMVTWLLLWSH